jgi:hypothetical protein
MFEDFALEVIEDAMRKVNQIVADVFVGVRLLGVFPFADCEDVP